MAASSPADTARESERQTMSYEKGDRDRADPCKIYVGGNPEMEEDLSLIHI